MFLDLIARSMINKVEVSTLKQKCLMWYNAMETTKKNVQITADMLWKLIPQLANYNGKVEHFVENELGEQVHKLDVDVPHVLQNHVDVIGGLLNQTGVSGVNYGDYINNNTINKDKLVFSKPDDKLENYKNKNNDNKDNKEEKLMMTQNPEAFTSNASDIPTDSMIDPTNSKCKYGLTGVPSIYPASWDSNQSLFQQSLPTPSYHNPILVNNPLVKYPTNLGKHLNPIPDVCTSTMVKNDDKCLFKSDMNSLCSGANTNPNNLIAPIPGPQWMPQTAEAMQSEMAHNLYTPPTCPIY